MSALCYVMFCVVSPRVVCLAWLVCLCLCLLWLRLCALYVPFCLWFVLSVSCLFACVYHYVCVVFVCFLLCVIVVVCVYCLCVFVFCVCFCCCVRGLIMFVGVVMFVYCCCLRIDFCGVFDVCVCLLWFVLVLGCVCLFYVLLLYL